MYEDVVGRRIRDRCIHAEDRQLDFVPRPRAACDQHAVQRVPACNHRTAALVVGAVEFSVHPYLRVVVDAYFEPDAGSGRIEPTNALWNGEVNPVPVE